MPVMTKSPTGHDIVILSRDEYDRLIDARGDAAEAETATVVDFKPKTTTKIDGPDWKPVVWWRLLLLEYLPRDQYHTKLEFRWASHRLEYRHRPMTEEETDTRYEATMW